MHHAAPPRPNSLGSGASAVNHPDTASGATVAWNGEPATSCASCGGTARPTRDELCDLCTTFPARYMGTYQQYLHSPYWRAIRRRALIVAAWRCQRCGRGQRDDVRLEVHHLTYDRLGCEQPEDLEALCDDCHGAEHGIEVTAK